MSKYSEGRFSQPCFSLRGFRIRGAWCGASEPIMNDRIEFDHDAGGGQVLLQIGARCMVCRALLVAKAAWA